MSGTRPCRWKSPHVSARAAEARLHLVGDEERARLACFGDGFLQKTRWVREDAVARKNGVDQQGRRFDVACAHVGERLTHVICERSTDIAIVAVGIGRWNRADVVTKDHR